MNKMDWTWTRIIFLARLTSFILRMELDSLGIVDGKFTQPYITWYSDLGLKLFHYNVRTENVFVVLLKTCLKTSKTSPISDNNRHALLSQKVSSPRRNLPWTYFCHQYEGLTSLQHFVFETSLRRTSFRAGGEYTKSFLFKLISFILFEEENNNTSSIFVLGAYQ